MQEFETTGRENRLEVCHDPSTPAKRTGRPGKSNRDAEYARKPRCATRRAKLRRARKNRVPSLGMTVLVERQTSGYRSEQAPFTEAEHGEHRRRREKDNAEARRILRFADEEEPKTQAAAYGGPGHLAKG